jgi:enamine deaminase RidA (YjgF/YER057c/UK114 family)
LADIDDYAALNDWWRREFDDIDQAPSRFTYQAGGLPSVRRSRFRRSQRAAADPGYA